MTANKTWTENAEINSAINALSETLSAGKNGVKCAVVAISLNTTEYALRGRVERHVLAQKTEGGSYVTWFFNGTCTNWGHYDMTLSEGLEDLRNRARNDCEVLLD